MFFQPKHSLSENEFRISYDKKNIDFAMHLHRSFEYYEQLHGVTEVVVGDNTYVLREGDAVLIFPFQTHSYRPVETGAIAFCVFSPNLASDFFQKVEKKIPICNKFKYHLTVESKPQNVFSQRSVTYGICGAFDSQNDYIEKKESIDYNVLTELLFYAENHFKTECRLRDAASEIGYDYAYISKFFKRKVGISFKEYVNMLRVRECKKLLGRTSKSISEIAELSGFHSLRSLDREFTKATSGVTPSEYRKRKQ